jgi:pseudaminic acid cytidylyltransferase
MKNSIICIIPARKGSKRIKNKNSKYFYGLPIISHVILNLKKFNLFDEIFVSTNSQKITELSNGLGVKVLKRSEKLSNDYVDTKTVISNAINQIENLGYNFKRACCVYPTSVFLKLNHLNNAINLLKKNTPYVFSAKEYEHSIFRSFYINKNNFLIKNYKKLMNRRTQTLKKTFHDAAQFYLGWKDSWKNKIDVFNSKSKFIFIKKMDSVDIDNQDDWETAELLWKINKLKFKNIS